MNTLDQAYDIESFRQNGHELIDFLADHLAESKNESAPVVELTTPQNALAEMNDLFRVLSEAPNSTDKSLLLFQQIAQRSIRLHHPKYMGHQISPALPVASLAGLVSDFLNNGMGVFEMGVSGTAIEKFLIDHLANRFGFSSDADGILTSGGTLGNLTALLAARRSRSKTDDWQDGTSSRLAVLVSDQAHYCIDKAVRTMGWGKHGAISVATNERYQMCPESLQKKYEEAIDNGLEVIAVVGSACSTATGSFDDLRKIGEFCEENKLWFHVDGAHGAATIYSSEFRNLLDGIELADSVVMDFHKLLMTPALATAVVFRNGLDGAKNFSFEADYLWEQRANELDHDYPWHDLAKRTFECTKSMFGLKAFSILALYGENAFDENVTRLYRSARTFAESIESRDLFELAVEPQSNIVCFRIRPKGIPLGEGLDEVNRTIRKLIVANGDFYLVQTRLRDGIWLRCTIANPFTQKRQFEELLSTVESKVHEAVPT